MKRFGFGFLLAVLLLGTLTAIGQQLGTIPVTPVTTQYDSCDQTGTSVTSAATITLTPSGGQYVYICGLDIYNAAGSSAVTAAAVTTMTTTNLSGSPAYTVASGVTAGLSTNQMISIPGALKAQAPGTAVTFVLPTFATNQSIRVNVYWKSRP